MSPQDQGLPVGGGDAGHSLPSVRRPRYPGHGQLRVSCGHQLLLPGHAAGDGRVLQALCRLYLLPSQAQDGEMKEWKIY